MSVVGIGAIVFCFIVTVAGVITAKGFYCKDPDTGKLYPVNTTWPSISFCGSYTCKLRRKNYTESEQFSHGRTAQVIDTSKTDDFKTTPISKEEKLNCTLPIGYVIDNGHSNVDSLINKDKITDNPYVKLENFKNVELGAMDREGDRYLTEEEIKALTILLQTMKKSDLEAILEVYNLAQDIYKEIDKASDESTFRPMEIDKNKKEYMIHTFDNTAQRKDFVSYWYEPFAPTQLKPSNMAEVQMPSIAVNTNSKEKETIDEYVEGSNLLSSPQRPASNSRAYFSGPFINSEFNKLPYYYPMSDFQRQASYIRPDVQYNTASYQNVPNVNPNPAPKLQGDLAPPVKCCKIPEGPFKKISPWYKLIHKPYVFEMEKMYEAQKKPVTYTENKINDEMVHYPFAFMQYNLSNAVPSTNIVVNSVVDNPWAFFNLPRHHHHQPHVGSTAYIQVPNNVLISPETGDEIPNEDAKSIDKTSDEEKPILPEWQTEQLSSNVISDVRANIDESRLLPFPFRKKIKLERVGKVIKLDDLNRSRRDAKSSDENAESDEFEAYIERSTCQTDTEPGFFRMGNSTEPFPACCPQRIS